MSFTDRKSFVVDEKALAGFTRHGGRFHCSLCGHDFQNGDTARWIYANSTPELRCGNFFVCHKCDLGDEQCLKNAKTDFTNAVESAKRWGIYGPDWERDLRNLR